MKYTVLDIKSWYVPFEISDLIPYDQTVIMATAFNRFYDFERIDQPWATSPAVHNTIRMTNWQVKHFFLNVRG